MVALSDSMLDIYILMGFYREKYNIRKINNLRILLFIIRPQLNNKYKGAFRCYGYNKVFTNQSLPIIIKSMDIEPTSNSRKNRFSNNHMLESLSRGQSFMSLERLSSNRNSSLSNRVSLVNAMELESSNRNSKGGHDEFYMEDAGRKFEMYRRSSNKSKDQYQFKADIEQKDLNRKSQYKIKHECACSHQECLLDHCICFLTPREICVIGQCCPQCIAIKNDYLQSTRGFQLQKQRKQKEVAQHQNNLLQMIKQKNCKNLHYLKQVHADQPCMKDLVFCTCKKSHCQKRYCLCFQKGIKCGQFCVCVECQNKQQIDEFEQQQRRRWQRYATYQPYDDNQHKAKAQIDPDIEQYLGLQQQQQEGFNQTMQFQPVNFDSILQNGGP